MPTGSSLGRPLEVLLIEDTPADAELTQATLRQASVPINVHHVEDGEQAMQFLRHASPFEAVPRPDMVLLDLSLPHQDGRQILAAIRRDKQLASLPVIVLTASDAPGDVDEIYRLKANCYVHKPADRDQFATAIQSFAEFWLLHANLPLLPDRGTTV